MSVKSSVFDTLMQILAAKQPISAGSLISAMGVAGFNPTESRRAIQLAFERGRIRLDERMRVVIVETRLAAA